MLWHRTSESATGRAAAVNFRHLLAKVFCCCTLRWFAFEELQQRLPELSELPLVIMCQAALLPWEGLGRVDESPEDLSTQKTVTLGFRFRTSHPRIWVHNVLP